ncbi:MAG TPA: hypothetical protein VFB06_30045 [Streptosporangiaceae bacterium]|nr:hypothetical protein [Streptosporangiaceae bacterium]
MAQWVIEVRDAASARVLGYHLKMQADGPGGGLAVPVSAVLADTPASAHQFPTEQSAEFIAGTLAGMHPDRSFKVISLAGSPDAEPGSVLSTGDS